MAAVTFSYGGGSRVQTSRLTPEGSMLWQAPTERPPDTTSSDRPRAYYRPVGTDGKASAFATVKRTFTEFSEDNLSDLAAALTYYGLLALFPAIIALVSLVGLVRQPRVDDQDADPDRYQIGPRRPRSTPVGPHPVDHVEPERGRFPLVLGTRGRPVVPRRGTSARSCGRRTSIYETPEGRPIWKLRPLQILVTLAMVLLPAHRPDSSVVLTGPDSPAPFASPLGLSSTAVTVWNIAKWPVLPSWSCC